MLHSIKSSLTHLQYVLARLGNFAGDDACASKTISDWCFFKEEFFNLSSSLCSDSLVTNRREIIRKSLQ